MSHAPFFTPIALQSRLLFQTAFLEGPCTFGSSGNCYCFPPLLTGSERGWEGVTEEEQQLHICSLTLSFLFSWKRKNKSPEEEGRQVNNEDCRYGGAPLHHCCNFGGSASVYNMQCVMYGMQAYYVSNQTVIIKARTRSRAELKCRCQL